MYFQSSHVYADEAGHLSSALVQQGPVGAGRKAVLTWLLSAVDSSKQVATTRAKAIKALGLVAENDPKLLAFPTVQNGVNRALQVSFLPVFSCPISDSPLEIPEKQHDL